MNCREFTDFLMAYLDEELPSGQRSAFEGHIHDCPPCMDYLKSYEATVALGREVCQAEDAAPADAPEALVQAILKAREN